MAWRLESDGTVVGLFATGEHDFLCREIESLARLVQERLDTAPLTLPFGDTVAISATAALPDDPRLRALLAAFCGTDEPDGLLRWQEPDLWDYLHACASSAARAWVEVDAGWEAVLDDAWARQAFFEILRAIAAVATYRVDTEADAQLRELFDKVHRGCLTIANGLANMETGPDPED